MVGRFALPLQWGMTLFIVFVLYPQIKNIYIALTNYSIICQVRKIHLLE